MFFKLTDHRYVNLAQATEVAFNPERGGPVRVTVYFPGGQEPAEGALDRDAAADLRAVLEGRRLDRGAGPLSAIG